MQRPVKATVAVLLGPDHAPDAGRTVASSALVIGPREHISAP
jgi:hypothetical protein